MIARVVNVGKDRQNRFQSYGRDWVMAD
jgi:hypothetical protein